MGWSTRELAELAGTSLRTVRHYHEVGLLDEPERAANGYKSYQVAHLMRVVQIKRLSDLGFSLSEIAAMANADEHPEQALRTLDAELAATIERLQRARVELGLILRQCSPTDLPAELAVAAAGADLSDNDRAFVGFMTRILGPSGLEAYGELLQNPALMPGGPDFDNLPADAAEDTRAELARRLAPQIKDLVTAYPGLADVGNAPGNSGPAGAIEVALSNLYNPAQVDVLQRVAQSFRARAPGPDQTST